MARVQVEHLSYRIGALQILREVSLNVDEGQCLALLGPSGCGKTSTLRAIAGFVHPSGGRIAIGGREMLGLPPHKRNLGVVFQDYALFPHMTVQENIAYGLRMRRTSRTDAATRVAAAVAAVRLDALKDRYPAQLSGGQQQRVALARALVVAPDVLLLDEPLGALDRKLREEMQVELKRIQRESGITTIIVTHDQEEALSLSDRVAVMFDGRIAQVGAPEDVYRRPTSRRVMEFLGEANVFAAQRTEAGLAIGANGAVLPVPLDCPGGRAPLVAGVRPERAVLRPAGGGSLFGTVRDVVYKGAHADVYVGLAPDCVFAVRWTEASGLRLSDLTPGAPVSVTVPADAVMIFEEQP